MALDVNTKGVCRDLRNEAQRNAVNPIYININLTFLQTVFIFIGSLKRTTPAFHATPPREGNLISRATARVAPTLNT